MNKHTEFTEPDPLARGVAAEAPKRKAADMSEMSLRNFHNGLRVLFCIDQNELVQAGVTSARDPQVWRNFRDDPVRWLLHCDDETAGLIWAVIEKRGRFT